MFPSWQRMYICFSLRRGVLALRGDLAKIVPFGVCRV
jgi:hypothetical protein